MGALEGIRWVRQSRKPFLGTCGGFQHVVLEYARNVLGIHEAQHEEYDPYASKLIVSRLPCSLVGKRLLIELSPDSLVYKCYGIGTVEEEYYCNFGLNPSYQQLLHENGLLTVGLDSEGEARILELRDTAFL